MEELGRTVKDTGSGEHRHLGIGVFLTHHRLDRPYLCLRDLGRDPDYPAARGGFPPEGGAADICQTTQELVGCYLVDPLLEEAIQAVGLKEMETYISSGQNTVAQYFTKRPILDLFLEVERRPVLQVPKRWW